MWLLCSVLSEVLQKQKTLFTDDVREECLRILGDMRRAAHQYLLKPVHEALKVSLNQLFMHSCGHGGRQRVLTECCATF